MDMMIKRACVVGAFVASGCALGQTFPIVPLTEPIYPFEDPEYDWRDDSFSHSEYAMHVLGDLNDDGASDLILYDLRNHYNWVYLNDGHNSFFRPIQLNDIDLGFFNTEDIEDLLVIDFDHDGDQDLLFVSDLGRLSVCLQDNMQFAFSQLIAPDGVDIGHPDIQAADFNGDGYKDFLVTSKARGSDSIWLIPTAGPGAYLTPLVIDTSILQCDTTELNHYAPTDIDADGDLDLLMYNECITAVAEFDSGVPMPAYELQIDTPNFNPEYRKGTLADVNADGLTDIVVLGGEQSNSATNMLGVILAPFTNGETRTIPIYHFPDLESDRNFILSNRPQSVILTSPGDLDGDGTEELLIWNDDLNAVWRITDPINVYGRFGISNEHPIYGDVSVLGDLNDAKYQILEPSYLDINDDGVLDRLSPLLVHEPIELFAFYTELGHNGIMLAAELGNPFMPKMVLDEQETIDVRGGPVHLKHADLDYDGIPEIMNSAGSYTKLVQQTINGEWYYDPPAGNSRFSQTGFRVTTAQLDSDSRLDVVSKRYEGGSYSVFPTVYLNVEIPAIGETYLPQRLYHDFDFYDLLAAHDIAFESTNGSFALADVDNDGDADIMVAGTGSVGTDPTTAAVLLWSNDGDGGFTPQGMTALNSQGLGDTYHNAIAYIDADHDGDQDLICAQRIDEDQNLGVYLNDGQGAFSYSHAIETISGGFPENLHQYWVDISDIDLDGHEDVVSLSKQVGRPIYGSELAIIYNSESGLATESDFIASAGAAEVHIADLDDNGLPDLFTCSYESPNSISVYFQTSPREFLPAISVTDIPMSAIDAIDMNFDGRLDLIGGGTDSGDLRVIYSVPAPCLPDLNLDDTLNFFDITLFIELYLQERPLVDLNRDGAHDFFDVTRMIETYTQGCP